MSDRSLAIGGVAVGLIAVALQVVVPGAIVLWTACLCVGVAMLSWAIARDRPLGQKLLAWRMRTPMISTLVVAVLAALIFGGGFWLITPQKNLGMGMRMLALEFSIPTVGEPIWAISKWENASAQNLTVVGKYNITTIGLGDAEALPFTRGTEDRAESQGWNQVQRFDAQTNTQQIEPHAELTMRFTSDPAAPLDQHIVDEFKRGRARVYLVGEQRWNTGDGSAHGVEFCAWSDGTGRAVLCHQHNRSH